MTEARHGASLVSPGGGVSDQATAAQLVALATPGMHVGTPTDFITIAYRGQTISFRPGIPIIADSLEYAALAGQPITWES